MKNQTYFCSTLKSPVGNLVAVFSESKLKYLLFDYEAESFLKNLNLKKVNSHPMKKLIETELGEYFSGQRKKFSIPLELEGTEFQKKSWKALQNIPFGKTISYSEQANAIKSQAVRAVGTANSKNPICIIVPCHRVTRQNGEIGGYAGGIEIKKKLLQLEAKFN